MERLDKKKFSIALKLSDDLYRFFLSNPGYKNSLSFDSTSKEIVICLGNSSEPAYQIAKTEPCDEYFFSVVKSQFAKYKGHIDLKGSLQPPRKEEKIAEDKKRAIAVIDHPKENFKPKPFALHEYHDVFLMANLDEAAKKSVRQKFGQRRVRGDERVVTKKLKDLFKLQNYWKIKNLSDETGQPEDFVRDIMKKIGHRVTSGVFRYYWELNPASQMKLPCKK